jgi:ParB family transcriptional regulator, chromosome partitioning protein
LTTELNFVSSISEAQVSTPVDLQLKYLKPPSWVLRPLDEETVSGLARSIEQFGMLQPIIVRPRIEGYEIVLGYHRLEACRRLEMETIRAIIVHLADEEAFLVRVAENLHRNNYVDPLEEARGYKRLIDAGWTIHKIAHRLGKSDGYISDRLGIINRLDSRVLLKVSAGNGSISPSHAEILARIRDHNTQRELADFVQKKRLSVRALEDMINGVPSPRKVKVVEAEDNCIAIPKDFLTATQILPSQHAHLYFRGKKLIIENLDNRTRKPRTTKTKHF